MKEYVTNLMEGYMLPQIAKMGLDAGQRVLLILDVYSSHRDKLFLDWVNLTYPQLILLFVPACFTAFLQPLDVAFNSSLKALIMDFCTKWFSAIVCQQVLDGKNPAEVKMDVSLSGLKGPFCKWLSEANHVNISKQANTYMSKALLVP